MDLRHFGQTDLRGVIVQCTDYSKLKYTKNGDVLDNKPRHLASIHRWLGCDEVIVGVAGY